jgi:hypothetical protein
MSLSVEAYFPALAFSELYRTPRPTILSHPVHQKFHGVSNRMIWTPWNLPRTVWIAHA